MHPGAEGISLRAHHLFCARAFAGDGYSAEFSNNMKRIVRALKSPSRRVKIVEGADDICAFCPHVTDNYCGRDNERVLEMDRIALGILRIKAGSVHPASYLQSGVKEALIKGSFYDVCAGCQWFESHCSTASQIN